MVRRLKKTVDSHDSCVSAIAEELKKDKWEVSANLDGWRKPSKIGSLVPDVEAKKEGCLTRICEVATKEMFNGDKNRYLEFQNYCDEYDFHFYLMKDGKRIKIDPNDLDKLNQK
jgi:hypothetical protein